MANGIDPRISLASQPLDLANLFSQNLSNQQQRVNVGQQSEQAPFQNQQLQLNTELLQAQQPANLQLAQEAASPLAQLNRRDKARLQSVVQGAIELSPLLEANDISGARSQLIARKARLEKLKLPTETTDESLALLDSNPEMLMQRVNQGIALGQQAGFIEAPKQASVAVRSSAPIINPDTGQLSIPTFDPNTQTTRLVPVEGATQETPAQKSQREIKGAVGKKRAELKETRTSQIKTELGDRNRNAARSQRPLKQALRLAQTASQGLSGSAKLQLSRLIPGIDSTNEGALDATLKQLALEQLQQFKGPTTDFEFGVTQSIAGSLGNSKESNIARIKSLDRNNWFNQREFQQFQKHSNAGGDPDTFSFNFGEPVKTKKGVFTLQDIQDTAVDGNLTIEETLQRLNQ